MSNSFFGLTGYALPLMKPILNVRDGLRNFRWAGVCSLKSMGDNKSGVITGSPKPNMNRRGHEILPGIG